MVQFDSKDLEKTISDFQNQRKTFGDTIKRNFPGKNLEFTSHCFR